MASTTRTHVLGCPVDLVGMEAAVERLVQLAGRDTAQPGLVVTLNPEMVMRARRETGFRAVLETAALIVPDGVGVVRALRRRGHADIHRVGGADLLEAYLPRARSLGQRVALVGAGHGVADRAAMVWSRRYPGLDVVSDGGDPDYATAARVGALAPALVAAAYGAGRQEGFLREHLVTMRARVGIGVGGTLDYVAGTARRAPEPVRLAGFEWLWRLFTQPSRWRRQAVLPLFWWLERREARR